MDITLGRLHRLVWIALMAALITIGAYAHFPIGPVPISLQVLFVLLAGFLLGPLAGPAAVCLYIAAGIIGLPVFYGGTSGLGHVLGPTGGYLAGFVAAAAVTGLAGRFFQGRSSGWLGGILAATLAYLPIYGLGLLWLKVSLDIDWAKVLLTGMVPFLPSDCLQIVGSVAAGRFLRKNQLVPDHAPC
jgi:biotin transport system substrate-specific component